MANPKLQSMIDAVNAFRDARNWRQFHTPKDLAAQVAIEAGELQECFLWKNEEQTTAFLAGNGKERVQKEVADVFNSLLMLVDDLGIDLEQALLAKLEENAEKYPVEKSRGVSTKYTDFYF